MKIYELLDKPHKWAKGYCAYDAKGNQIPYNHPDATRWCLDGAICKCYCHDEEELVRVYEKVNMKLASPIAFNDDPGTTYQDMIKFCKGLDI